MPDQNNPTDVSPTTPPAPMDIPPVDASIPPPFPPEVAPPEGAAPPPDSGSAAPSFDIPPVIMPSQPQKKFGGKRVIATILGLLVLVGGLGAGVILVRQQQLFQQKAASGTGSCTTPDGRSGDCKLDYACDLGSNDRIDVSPNCNGVKTCCVPKITCPGGYDPGYNAGKCKDLDGIFVVPPGGSSTNGCCKLPPPPKTLPPSCPPWTVTCPDGTKFTESDCATQKRFNDTWLGIGGENRWKFEACQGRGATPPPTSTYCPKDCVSSQSQCKSGTQVGGVGYGDCGVGEYCCDKVAAPIPTPNICALSQRDPNSQGYCDRSAPNTPNCTDKVESSACTIVSQCGGGTGTCVVINQGGANAECQCQKGAAPPPTKTPTPTPTPPPPPPGSPPPAPPTAQCLNIQAFDANWNQLTANQLKALKAGDKVRFTVAGQASSGSFDKARFKINGVQRPEVTGKRPGTEEYFDEYTIPEGITTFSINAQIHHENLGWSN